MLILFPAFTEPFVTFQNLPVIRPQCWEGALHIFMSGRDRSVLPSHITCVFDNGTPNEKGNQKIIISCIRGNGDCCRRVRKLSVDESLLRLNLLIRHWWSRTSTAHIEAISGGISVIKKRRYQLRAHTAFGPHGPSVSSWRDVLQELQVRSFSLLHSSESQMACFKCQITNRKTCFINYKKIILIWWDICFVNTW